jgi:glyoxylase-like metal-dependent hydrolase (beta-lactamase superfamily II)
MRLWSLEGNRQWLDGGAMFGNCPRAVWESWCPPDASHRIELACRALLVEEDDGRVVLFEAGVGAFLAPELRSRYGVQEPGHVLLDSLAAVGFAPEAVDVAVLSHLHFDHAGGLLTAWRDGESTALAFPNARYVVSEAAWQRSLTPHARDRASFIPELCELLAATGRVERVECGRSETLGDGYGFTFSEGHTPGLMLTRIDGGDPGPITFAGDLVPGVPWLHLPITMGYDRFPERLIDEKTELLRTICADDEWLFLTHDPDVALCRVSRDERGRYGPRDPRAKLAPA